MLVCSPGLAFPHEASREELAFAPDRPGVGDSAGVVPLGRGMIEGGAERSFGDPSLVTAPVVYLRIGVAANLELRLGLPSMTSGAGGFSLSGPSVGVKAAGSLWRGLSWSVVPTVDLAPLEGEGRSGASLSLNGVYAKGELGAWVNATPAYEPGAGLGVSGGGGLSYGVSYGGWYVNGGYKGASPFAGAGVWWLVAPAFQLDVGVDAAIDEGLSPVLMVGTSFIL